MIDFKGPKIQLFLAVKELTLVKHDPIVVQFPKFKVNKTLGWPLQMLLRISLQSTSWIPCSNKRKSISSLSHSRSHCSLIRFPWIKNDCAHMPFFFTFNISVFQVKSYKFLITLYLLFLCLFLLSFYFIVLITFSYLHLYSIS